MFGYSGGGFSLSRAVGTRAPGIWATTSPGVVVCPSPATVAFSGNGVGPSSMCVSDPGFITRCVRRRLHDFSRKFRRPEDVGDAGDGLVRPSDTLMVVGLVMAPEEAERPSLAVLWLCLLAKKRLWEWLTDTVLFVPVPVPVPVTVPSSLVCELFCRECVRRSVWPG